MIENLNKSVQHRAVNTVGIGQLSNQFHHRLKKDEEIKR